MAISVPYEEEITDSGRAVAGGRKELTTATPNPFLVLANSFRPRDIKQAFRMAWVIYSNNGAIARAIYKLAEYPITDFLYESESTGDDLQEDRSLFKSAEEVQDAYKKIFEDILNIHDGLIEIGLDYFLYGNAIPYLATPWRRNLVCERCKKQLDSGGDTEQDSDKLSSIIQRSEDIAKLTWDGRVFRGDCPVCDSKQTEFQGQDVPSDRFEDLRLVRMNIYQVEIMEAELTGSRRYTYNPGMITKARIRKNDRWYLEHEPLLILKAIAKDARVELNPNDVYHFKMPAPSTELGNEWGFPMVISCLQTIYFIAMLRKGMEAMSMSQVNPAPVVSPAQPPQTLGMTIDYDIIREQLMAAYEESTTDPSGALIAPFPVNVSFLNAPPGRNFLALPETGAAMEELFLSLGLPQGLLTGNANWAGNSIAMRVIENSFLVYRKQIQRVVDFLNRRVRAFFSLPKCKITMAEFKMLDDQMQRQLDLQAAGGKLLSLNTMLKRAGLSPEKEMKQLNDEALEFARLQAEMNNIQQESMNKAQKAMQDASIAMSTESSLAQIETMADRVISMVRRIEEMGYTRDQAVRLAAGIIQTEQANIQAATQQNQSNLAYQAYMQERLSNATVSQNRASEKQLDFSLMGRNLAPQTLQQQVAMTPQQIAMRIVLWTPDERDKYLKSLYNNDPQTYGQVLDFLNAYANNQPQG